MKAIAQIFLAENHQDHQDHQDYQKLCGYISIVEDQNKITHFTLDLSNLPPGEKAIHIHEKGDPFKCCDNLGGHYNPFNKNHGDISNKEDRHVGDLGNISIDNKGKCFTNFTDNLVRLSGEYSVIGRSFVIHENKDDLGLGNDKNSKINGNSGKRIAYGIIGIA